MGAGLWPHRIIVSTHQAVRTRGLMLLSVSHMISASGSCNQRLVLFPHVSARKASPTDKCGRHAHRESAGDECDHRSHLAWMRL